jgi:hypothetical protein
MMVANWLISFWVVDCQEEESTTANCNSNLEKWELYNE